MEQREEADLGQPQSMSNMSIVIMVKMSRESKSCQVNYKSRIPSQRTTVHPVSCHFGFNQNHMITFCQENISTI